MQDNRAQDNQIVFHEVPWSVYESLAAARGEARAPRLTYHQGSIEIVSPSRTHEQIGYMIDVLLGIYAEEAGIDLNGTRSWTLRDRPKKLGAEADQSYIIGNHPADVPDLAVEVIWTHGDTGKLDIYAGLGVKEVWFWRAGKIEAYVLGRKGYARHARSKLLPGLDFSLFARFIRPTNQMAARRAYRAALRKSLRRR